MADEPDDDLPEVFIFPVPPQAYGPVRRFFRKYAAFVRAAEFAAALGLMAAAWFAGGEMIFVAPALIVVWIIAIAGFMASNLSSRATAIWCLLAFVVIGSEGAFLYQHFHGEIKSPPLGEGASINIAVLGPRHLSDGYVFLAKIENTGNSNMLNYTYHFGEAISARILTTQEENKLFNEMVGDKFYPVIEKAAKGQIYPKMIFASLAPGNYFELSQPDFRFNDDKIQSINARKLFVYNFLAVRYTDKTSMEKDIYYFAEYCARYEPSANGINHCHSHNFIKSPAK